MKIIPVLALVLCVSCGFSSEDKNEKNLNIESLKVNDLDGDLIEDTLENEIGLDKYLADVADVNIKFEQGYEIKLILEDEAKKGVIVNLAESINQDDVGFNYTYGSSLLKTKAFVESAKVARFATHSYGDVTDFELSKYVYPLTNENYRFQKQLDVKNIIDKDKFVVKNISLNFKANLYLESHPLIKEIRNPVFEVYYYDYRNRTYKLIKEEKIDLVLKENVLESFQVNIENIPNEFIFDNYFKRGEFLIISLKDYEVPTIGANYTNQMASIKERTTPVQVYTPNYQRQYFVSSKSPKSLIQMLDHIYKENYEVSNNEVTKIGQFENNLSDYEELSKVALENKKGKWFAYTNKLNQHFLTYKYSPKDTITLAYITGEKLASQVKEKSRLLKAVVSNEDSINSLGTISKRSDLSFSIDTGNYWGERVIKDSGEFWTRPCRGNCRVSDYRCRIDVRDFTGEQINEPFSMEAGRRFFSLKVGDSIYSLNDLISVGVLEESRLEEYYFYHLKKSEYFFSEEENTKQEKPVSLYTPTFRESGYHGFKLVSMSGKTAHYECPMHTMGMAQGNNLPVSNESLNFKKWKHWVHQRKLSIGTQKDEVLDFNYTVTSEIKNYYN
ncbi:hypothetical protein DAY19_11655 [Halobacteriovorax vibrionivorans]|uniref:Lipoprotein n=1 Tax=Halobacteriovorax vibrionivorans TaxID=2152716 RepID=A0ABY0IGJ0_9BACT|nr:MULTISPECIES: hypothetical protein [Halobacteriovorax]RZF20634.1 hypothetical protein DAY19_11655 [Halobacteriovorax vibrionivorans]TGD48955.1 hypothetical protein EP118_02075 [Halobacteriovorax sp. Y22]